MEENKIEETQEEVKETETPVEPKEEPKKASTSVGIILIVVGLIIGVMCFFLGTMFANKEDKKEGTTTTTTKEVETSKKEEESTTTTSTTAAVTTTSTTIAKNITLKANKAKKDYEKDDEIKFKKDKYSNDDYSVKISGEEGLTYITIGKKEITVCDLLKAHRYKYFVLLELMWVNDAGVSDWFSIYDYDGNLLYTTDNQFIMNDKGEFENIESTTEEDVHYLHEDKVIYDSKTYTFTIKYTRNYSPEGYDLDESLYGDDDDEDDEDDEEEEEIETYRDYFTNYCNHLKNGDFYGEVYTTLTLNGNKFTEEKFSSGTKAKDMQEAVDFCKKLVNINIR